MENSFLVIFCRIWPKSLYTTIVQDYGVRLNFLIKIWSESIHNIRTCICIKRLQKLKFLKPHNLKFVISNVHDLY